MSDQKDLEKGSYPNEEKIALKDAENCGQATGDHEKSAANGGEAVKIVHPVDKQEFCGLSKEELQQFAKDPFWRKVRVILFAGFWVAWMAMLLAAIIIIILAPKCPKRPDMKWWEKSLFYRVCPRTYKDNDGDGNGDFKGLTEKLGYIHDDIHSNAIILTPIFKSKYEDLGFDVTSLDEINDVFGSENDFKNLISKAHKKDMKVVIDFVLNGVSTDNKWWKKEDVSKFVVRDNPDPLKSLYGEDSWNQNNNKFYYSTLTKDQPDLNLKNDDVFSSIKQSLKKWLKLGVDGIRIPHVAYLVESNSTLTEKNRAFSAETFNFIGKISNIVNEFEDKVIIADIGQLPASDNDVQQLFKNGVNLVDSLNLARKTDAADLSINIFKDIERTLNITGKKWNTWNLGNEDTSRIGDDEKNWYLRQMVGLLLKGTSIVYYGNELALENSNTKNENDKYLKRDKYRAPMMWEDNLNGGFTTGESWMKIDGQLIPSKCVRCQKARGKGTFLNFFSSLAKLRQEPSFQWGDLILEPSDNPRLLVFIRQATGFPGYMVVINTDPKNWATVDLTNHKENLPSKAKVVLATDHSGKEVDSTVDLSNFGLPKKSGIVLNWEAKDWKVE